MPTVTILDEGFEIDAARFLPLLENVVRDLSLPGGITIKIGGDEESRRLNKEFLGKDHATDVLSFPLGQEMPDGYYLGDVFICLPAAEDQAACGVLGLNVGSINSLSFTLAAALCTVAAILMAPISGASPQMGTMVGLKGFAAGVLGGLSQARSAILGGIIFGVGESMAGYFFGGESKEIIIFVLLMIVLGFRPTGLWGETQWQRAA